MFFRNKRVSLIFLPALAGVIALAVACSSGGSATPTPAPTPYHDDVVGAPALALGSIKIDLGNVAQDQRQLATILVINMGSEPLKVDQVDVVAAQGGDEPSTIKTDQEVAPGEASVLPITVGPHKTTGPNQVLVKIKSNDPERPLVTVPINFQVVAAQVSSKSGPRLVVDKDVFDVGIVPYDWPLYAHFILSNNGDAPLVLSEVPLVRIEEGC